MKKLSLLLIITAMSFTCFAQLNRPISEKLNFAEPIVKPKALEVEKNNTPNNRSVNAEGDTLLYFDFDGAVLPDGWTVHDNAGIGTWQIVTESTDAQWSQPADHYTGDFASKANGFAELPIFYYNCIDDGSGNLEYVGDLYGEGPTEIDATLETDWLDLSGSSNGYVQLVYNSLFILWNSHNYEVHVTTNDTDWTIFNATIVDGNTVLQSEWSPNNAGLEGYCTEQVFDITSAIAADPSHVKILFKVFGTYGYFMSIDDIRFIEPAYVNDVNMTNYYATWNGVYTIASGYPDDYNTNYSEVPANIIHPLHLGAKLHQSELDGENTRVHFTIDSASTTPLIYDSESSPVPSFGSGFSDDTVMVSPDTIVLYNPEMTLTDFNNSGTMGDGIPYYISYEAVSDDEDIDLSNNTANLETATTFGRMSYHWQPTQADLVEIDGVFGINSYGTMNGAENDMFVNKFNIYTAAGEEQAKIYGLRFFLPNDESVTFDASGNGVEIIPIIYFYNPTGGDGTGAYEPLTEINNSANNYTLTTSNKGNWVYLQFDENTVNTTDFPQNTTYFVGLKALNWNDQNFSIGVDKTYRQGNAHFKMNVDPYQGNWYYWSPGGSVMIDAYTKLEQINYDLSIGSGEIYKASNDLKVYPNPTTGHIKLENVENSTIQVYSLSGTLVKTKKSNNKNTTINISEFAKGTYLIRVVKENEVITKKINLLK
jgi:hypothetical protein